MQDILFYIFSSKFHEILLFLVWGDLKLDLRHLEEKREETLRQINRKLPRFLIHLHSSTHSKSISTEVYFNTMLINF